MKMMRRYTFNVIPHVLIALALQHLIVQGAKAVQIEDGQKILRHVFAHMDTLRLKVYVILLMKYIQILNLMKFLKIQQVVFANLVIFIWKLIKNA
ncbi:unnamed protein product [Paramecium octaurelia]|uniref:Secreted protein n=1 Tax=Paramecium octaurelia TaxID=43137 RepID=A0A8S1Y676_PAROT|nr:unnamed protein product [Paramecium octaurelia]